MAVINGEKKRPNGKTPLDRIQDLEEDVYGVEKRRHTGILDRVSKVEEGVADWMKAKLWVKAFTIGLGFNLIGGIVMLFTLWDIARKLAATIP